MPTQKTYTLYPRSQFLDPKHFPHSCSNCHTSLDRLLGGTMGIFLIPTPNNTFAALCPECAFARLPGYLTHSSPSEPMESYEGIILRSHSDKAVIEVPFATTYDAKITIPKIKDLLHQSVLCDCCNKTTVKLFGHHWYQVPTFKRFNEQICTTCNNHLTPYIWQLHPQFNNYHQLEGLSHILPPWDVQQLYIHTAIFPSQGEYFKHNGTLRKKALDNPDIAIISNRLGEYPFPVHTIGYRVKEELNFYPKGTPLELKINKGDLVKVIVWEDVGDGIIFTDETSYWEALYTSQPPPLKCFSKLDIID